MADIESFLILNMIEGLGPSRLKVLLEHFGSPEEVLRANQEKLQGIPNIGKALSQAIVSSKERIDLKEELELIERNQVRIITLFDETYPENLKEIFDPPILLYVKGELLAEDLACVAIVGSRRTSFYGRQTAERISQDLAQKGITVVSGMARGIDTASHRGALKGGGRTIAVLGNGLNLIYPPENAKLADEIAQSGALISEFPMKMPPYKENFPRRNRIISGLALGVVVVEAAQRSGSLITAGFALEQGREVFAVPGRADSFSSKGTHNLIKEGARLVENYEDIIEELSPILEKYIHEMPLRAKKEEEVFQPKLDGAEKVIYDSLSTEPKHIDLVADSTNLPISQILSTLMKLEVRRLVKELPGKMFVRR